MKKTYFSHDSNAHNDPKILEIRLTYGWEGYGIFWALIEKLFESGGYLNLSNIPAIQMAICPSFPLLDFIELCVFVELFNKDDTKFYSISLLKRINKIHEKSEKAKDSASKRWDLERTQSERNANAKRTQCDSNASKVNESKVKESGKTKRFTPPSLDEVNDYIIKNLIPVNPESWYHFYESKGWMIGKNKMKSWKSAVSTWASKNSQDGIDFIEKHKPNPLKRDPFKRTLTDEQLSQPLIDDYEPKPKPRIFFES